jgi:PAS domain S-box-containing protein
MRLLAITVSGNAKLTYCNDHFLRFTGWARGEVIGCNWFERFVPPGNRRSSDGFFNILTGLPSGRQYDQEIVCRAKKKRALIRWNNAAVRNSSGDVVGVASIGEDITEHRSLEREILATSTRERGRLAGELHEGLGQDIFGASLLAQSVENRVVKGLLPVAADLAQLRLLLRSSLETCRRVECGLCPLMDVNGGIVQALRALTKRPPQNTPQVALTVFESAPLRIAGDTLEHLYRIALEAFANALRHASATRIKVTLDIRRLLITLIVEDNGGGMPRATLKSERLGLRLMRYRARIIGASLSITQAEPRGTMIVLRCPQAGDPASAPFRRPPGWHPGGDATARPSPSPRRLRCRRRPCR